MEREPILAVDFGTTNSLAGVWRPDGVVETLPLDPLAADPTLFRSLIYFPHEDQAYYGAEAVSQYLENEMEGRLFRSFKAHLPNRGYLGTMIGNRIVTLEKLVGFFLLEIRKRAEKILGQTVEKVLLGRPARYSMDPLQDSFALYRMGKAAEFAGFKEFRFLPEPLAAAFDLRTRLDAEKCVLVGDFGGGTSDFTILKLAPRPFERGDVLSIEGCPSAGDAFDSVFMRERLCVHFGAKSRYRLPLGSNTLTMPPGVTERLFQPSHIVHLKEKETFEFIKNVRQCALAESDRAAVDRLMALVEEQLIFQFFERIEASKRALSQHDEIEFLFDEPGVLVRDRFLRREFETWSIPVRDRIFEALDRALQEAGLGPEGIDLVCLTGGTANVPLVRQALEERFGPAKLTTSAAFHSVQKGLVEGARLWGEGRGDFLKAFAG